MLAAEGVGVGVRSKVAPGVTLYLGDLAIPDVVIALSQQENGAFPDRYTARNIGGGVLKRFTVTFDYGNKVMILEPSSRFAAPEPYDRSGMWINRDGESFEVADVVPGGAAYDAGVRVGDRIVACNGKPASELRLALLRERFRFQPPGTAFKLTIATEGGQRTAKIVLKDLLAPTQSPGEPTR